MLPTLFAWLPAALPSSWGTLLSFEASNSSLAPSPTDTVTVSSASYSAPASSLSTGAVVGIAIGAFVLVLLVLAGVVARGLQRNKHKDVDKSVQLAYINEMTEADLDSEGEEEDGSTPGKVRGIRGRHVVASASF